MRILYSHRNGEKDPPAETGRYFLQGYMPMETPGAHAWGYTFGKGDELPYLIDVESGLIDLDGAGYYEPLAAFQGLFWGPVPMPVPPWEQDEAAQPYELPPPIVA